MEEKELKIIYEGLRKPDLAYRRDIEHPDFIQQNIMIHNKEDWNETMKAIASIPEKLLDEDFCYQLFLDIDVPFINQLSKTDQKVLLNEAKKNILLNSFHAHFDTDYFDVLVPQDKESLN